MVDPPRDAWRVTAVADARGWRLTHAVETHVHNDYLSGALELRAERRVEIVAPARGRYAFEHRDADEGDAVEVGGLRLVARATPGHTPEHLAWDVIAAGADRPTAVLTGGSLLVGSAGRTDLLGADATEELTRAQFGSLRALAGLRRRRRGPADARFGQLLHRRAGARRAHLDDRRGATHEPAACGARRGDLPGGTPWWPRGVSDLLRGDGAAQPRRTRRARPACRGPASRRGRVPGSAGRGGARRRRPVARRVCRRPSAGSAQRRARRQLRVVRRLVRAVRRGRGRSSCPSRSTRPSPRRPSSCSASGTTGSTARSPAASRPGRDPAVRSRATRRRRSRHSTPRPSPAATATPSTSATRTNGARTAWCRARSGSPSATWPTSWPRSRATGR